MKKNNKRQLLVVGICLFVFLLFAIFIAWLVITLVDKAFSGITSTETISLDGYENYFPLLFLAGIIIAVWYLWKPIKGKVSSIFTSSSPSKKFEPWDWVWRIFLTIFGAIASLFVLWVVFVVLNMVMYIKNEYFDSPERKSDNFTQKDYDAQFAQPSNGGESITFGKNPSGSSDRDANYTAGKSYRALQYFKKGERYEVYLGNPGFIVTPDTLDRWYTFELINKDDPSIKITVSVMKETGSLCTREKIVYNRKPIGDYYLVPLETFTGSMKRPDDVTVCQ